MDMNAIGQYLVSENIVGENVFLFEKPEKMICSDYILYNFKELDGGITIRHYQVDIRIISKDKLKVLDIKDKVINALDIYYKPCKIKDTDTIIRSIRLINGGGIIKNTEGEYNCLVYFSVKI